MLTLGWVPPPTPRRIGALCLTAMVTVGTLACGEGAALANRVTVDTLPSGIVRTMSNAPIDSGRWELAPVRVVQPPMDDPGEILSPSELQLTDDGWVVTFEGNPTVVRVYDDRGAFVRTIGAPGQGPGEFQAGMLALRGDSLVVQDPSNVRISTWHVRTGQLIAERRSVCCVWNRLAVDGSGRVWVPHMGSHPDSTMRAYAFLRTALTGATMDTVFVAETRTTPRQPRREWLLRAAGHPTVSWTVPFQTSWIVAVDPTGGVITGSTADYVLRVSRDGLDTTALFGREVPALTLSAADKQAVVEAKVREALDMKPALYSEADIRRAFDVSLVPDRRPARGLHAVDRAGRRWVQWMSTDTTATTFDLFDRDGRWLDVVRVPSALWPTAGYPRVAWGRDHVAVTAEDADGRPFVRILAIRRR